MRYFQVTLAPLLLAVTLPAQAVEWRAAVGGDLRWFDWREHQDDSQLLMERGALAAPAVQVELGQGPWFARVSSLWGGGLARYDGHLTDEDPPPPYEANAWEEIVDTHWRLGWQGERMELSAGWLQRDWNRFIEGNAAVSSAEERYRWHIATVGGALALPGDSNWRVALDVGVPVDSYQKVYLRKYDDLTLVPGDGAWWRVGLAWHLPANRAISVEPWYQEQYMDASGSAHLAKAGIPQPKEVYQPESVRRELGITIRLQFGAGHPGR